MGGENPERRTRQVNSKKKNKKKMNESSKTRLIKKVKEVSVALHLSGRYCNPAIIDHCVMKYDWTIKPSKLSTWIHKHHTEHIFRTNLFRNLRINYYEARKSLTGISRKRYCVNDVRGYFQDVFIEQSIRFREFPGNHGVEQHQLTTMYLRKHEDYRFIVITSTQSLYKDKCVC